MANRQLIKGAGDVVKSQGFYDLGAAVKQGLDVARMTLQVPNRVRANQKYQQDVNNYMSQLKTNLDFSGFTQAETGAMRDFLMMERKKYTDAAQMAAKYTDTTDPEYMKYVDIMQGVNNSFTNLAAQLESYKKNKLEYAQSQMDGLVSDGTDSDITAANNKVYGFYDVDGDGYVDEGYNAPFTIQEGGNIAFKMDDGSVLSYNNLKQVNYKDYVSAKKILEKNEAIYKSGKLVSDNEQTLYKLNLQEMLQNTRTLQSLIFDFRTELGGGVSGSRMNLLGNEWDNQNANGQVDLEYFRNEMTDILLETYINSGINGKSEFERKNPTNPYEGYSKGRVVVISETDNIMQDGKKLPAGEYYVYTKLGAPNRYAFAGVKPSSDKPVSGTAYKKAFEFCKIPEGMKQEEYKNKPDASGGGYANMAECLYKKVEEFTEIENQNK